MREISPGIFVETDQRGANYGAVLTDDGVIIIDTPIVPRQATAFRDELRRVAGASRFSISSTPTTTAATSWATNFSCPRRSSRTTSPGST